MGGDQRRLRRLPRRAPHAPPTPAPLTPERRRFEAFIALRSVSEALRLAAARFDELRLADSPDAFTRPLPGHRLAELPAAIAHLARAAEQDPELITVIRRELEQAQAEFAGVFRHLPAT